MPRRVVLAMASDADAARALAQCRETGERPPHLGFVSHDADEILHRFLQSVLDLVRPFTRGAPLERLDRKARRFVDLAAVNRRRALLPGEPCGRLAGSFAENEQIR